MPSIRIISLATALALIVAVFILWPDNKTDLLMDGDSSVAAEPISPATTLPATSETKTADGIRLESTGNPSEAITSNIQPSSTDEDAILVTVVMESDNLPVAGADVYLLSNDMLEYSWLERTSGRDSTDRNGILRQFGVHYQTDIKGQVKVPRAGEYRCIHAEKMDDYATSSFHGKSEEITFALNPNHRFKVKVVDAANKPAIDIPIALQLGDQRYGVTMQTVFSNSDGLSTFEGIEKHLLRTSNSGSSLYASIGFPMAPNSINKSDRVEITEQILEDGMAILTLPPSCTVVVKVFDLDGELCTERGSLQISNAPDRSGWRMELDNGFRIENGIATFPHVGLGVDLIADFHFQGSRNSPSIEFKSSSLPGDILTVEIWRQPGAFLVGKLLGDDGKPLAGQRVKFYEEINADEDGWGSNHRLTTNERGEFRYEIKIENRAKKVLSRELTISMGNEKVGTSSFKMELPNYPEIGETDLGQLQLTLPPIILAGVVLDKKGNPLNKARLTFQCAIPNGEHGIYWSPLEIRNISSNERGEFRCRGTAPPANGFRVNITADGFEPFQQEFTLGMAEASFELSKASVLLGSLLFDEGFSARDFRAWMQTSDGRRKQGRLTPGQKPGTAELRIEGNAGVLYTLIIKPPHGETLLEIPNILLKPGEENRPAEIQPFDITGQIKQIKIQVQNSQGLALNCRFDFSIAGKSGRDYSRSGELSLITKSEVEQVVIQSYGYAPKTLLGVEAGQTITLSNGLEVVFQIPKQYFGYRGLSVSLRAQGNTDIPLPRNMTFDSSGQLKMVIPEAGEYRFGLGLATTTDGSDRYASLPSTSYSIKENGQLIPITIKQEIIDQHAGKLLNPKDG